MQLEIYSLIALKDQISVSLEAICDSYSSLLWDIEFYQCGCFEVYIAASPQNVSIFQRGRIVARSDDAQHFGIIESLQLETDAEKGDYLTVTGRFLASLLERRIIYPTITANGSYEDIVRKVLLAILAQGHVLLEDVPGVGKTTLAKAFSKTLGLDSKRVQFTSDTLPSDIIGFSVFDKADGKLKYQSGAIMTNLLLADEINRTSSKTQSALLEAMEELQVTVDGVTRPLSKPFIVLATENPVGSAGTQMLPASQLDRFMLQLSMGYPNRASTAALLKDRHHVDPLSACQTVTSPAELEKLIAEVSNIHVADRIYDYIAELVDLTRSNAYVTLGVSPRGALAVTRAAKANAYLEGRDYVIPDDVCAVFPDVCVHRLILNSKARLQDYTAALILQNVLTSVQKPDVREFSSK